MKKRLLVLFLFSQVLLLSACGGDSEEILDALTNTESDSDKDGLTNEQELTVYFTSPDIADTDGDGISDGDEVNELGFSAAANLFRFNPLIADLPTMAIEIKTVPELVLRFTDASGTEHTFSNSTGGAEVETDTRSHTGGVSITLGVEKGVKIGTSGAAAESKVTASVTGSYSTTEEETKEKHKTWEAVTADSNFASRDTEGASIRIGISVENNSNLSYSLDHITLLASYIQGDASPKPVATLSYGHGGSDQGAGFQRTSFAPGDKSNLLLFSYDNLDLGTALDILKDARNMIVQPALYELVNAEGVPIAFNEGDVDAKTAEVIIDYGITRPQEMYHVAVLGSHGEGSLSIKTLLGEILNVDYIDVDGLTRVRGVGGDEQSRWVVLLTHNDGFVDETTFYDPDSASYDISNINVFPGNQLTLVYLTDVDGDGVGIREEILNGTDPEKADTDGDGINDDIEIRHAFLVNPVNLKQANRYPAFVYSNPIIADADGDGLNDLAERDRGLDPNNADTDGDGIGDFTDNFNGQLPIAASFTLSTSARDAVALTGTATAEAGSTVASIAVNWGDGSAEQLATGSASSLNISFTHTFATPADENLSTITIVITNNEGVSVTYVGDVKLYQELTLVDYHKVSGWRENLHIRELVDVNGDDQLDIVGFGGAAVQVSLWNGAGFGAKTIWLADHFGSDAVAGAYSKAEDPRFVIDYDNDGLKDIVAFSPDGVVWSKNMGGAFAVPTLIFAGHNSKGGWNSLHHPRLLADVDGNGTPDIVGFGAEKIFTFLSGGVNNNVIDASNEFTIGSGWNTAQHYRFVKDVDGDGRADVVGLGAGSMFAALGQSDGTFATAKNFKTGAVSFTNNNGWRPTDYPVFLEDINNDGKLDIVGFGFAAVQVMINSSTVGHVAFADPVIWNSDFVRAVSWSINDNSHQRFVVDINNDGYKDITGFGSHAVYTAANQLPFGDAEFDSKKQGVTSSFGAIADPGNWVTVVTETVVSPNPFIPPTIINHDFYHSRYIRDINNDGRADMLGFGNAGVVTQRMPTINQPVEQ